MDSLTTNNKILTEGLTAEEWVDLLNGDKPCAARKGLNYLDGNLEEEMIKLLSDTHKGRKKWREKGIIPRYRALTKMIIEKSGQLFKDAMPIFEVYQKESDTEDEIETQAFMDEIDKIEFQEFLINLDQVTRLLKTSVVLIQYDSLEGKVVLDILSRANCQVVIDPSTRGIRALIYITSSYNEIATYRIFTKEEVIDLREVKVGSATRIEIADRVPNSLGIVPAVAFHDTTIPRTGFWNTAPNDLIGLNELVNLHITDSEYAISWAKLPTLFTIDCDAQNSQPVMEVSEMYGSPLPRQTVSDGTISGGPSQAISLTSNTAGGTPSVQYLSPKVDITPLDDTVAGWIKSYSADWSVRVEVAGTGRVANSGFQLVIEELPNMELRRTRQRMFEAGFKRFYRVYREVLRGAGIRYFSDGGELFTEFSDPILPVDAKENEEVWDLRITGNRATVIDYFMAEYGIDKEEAMEKYLEIVEFNKSKAAIDNVVTQEEVNKEVTEAQAIEQEPEEKEDPRAIA